MQKTLTAAQRVALARQAQRPGICAFIDGLFTGFFEMKGDRLAGEDGAILGGVALYHGQPVTVIGTRKGRTVEEKLRCRTGRPIRPAILTWWRTRAGGCKSGRR